MDENEFFREATLRICGNLEIENAMHSLLLYLKDLIPVARMYYSYYDDALQSMRIFAYADEEMGKKLDQIVLLSKDALETGRNASRDSELLLIENPQEHPLSRHMMKSLSITMSSIIWLILRSKDNLLGNFVLHSVGEPKFVESDLELVDSLRNPLKIAMSNTLKHREIIKLKDLLADDNRFLHEELRRLSGDEIVGANFGLKDVMHKVNQVAPLDSPVLLLGETGVGKDVIANAIHHSSPRKNKPFISVNCGAIPDTLIDSELFGHEKGAFTGAISQKRGRFERADKGTIFLDEVAELPLLSQTRLLHVLQNKTIERVGGTKTLNLDIRVIAATNQDLKERVKTNQFREDLWFRLNVFPITIPPLRERKSDIPALLQHFLALKSKQLKLPGIPPISPGAVETLMGYHWPGNVRELENIVERTLILDRKGPLHFDHLKADQREEYGRQTGEPTDIVNLDEVFIQHIRKILDRTGGKIHGPGGAADLLGINPSTLRNRMKKLGIVYKRN
jgi:transcriptional regulator with GAF, ATPase, and Fis domain